MIKIIGIDPGLAATGIGLVEGSGFKAAACSYGFINTPKHLPLASRLEIIYTKLRQILKSERPDAMVVEDVFTIQENPRSGITLGKTAGVILLAGCRTGIPVTEIAVREAKQVLTGNGRASKEQLEKAVRHLLNRTEPIRPFHASDALALALIGLFRHQAAARNRNGANR